MLVVMVSIWGGGVGKGGGGWGLEKIEMVGSCELGSWV